MGLLYSRMKVFHFKEKLDSLPRESVTILPPINVRIKPTNVCNHNCWYCAYRVQNLQLGQDICLKDFIPREKMLEIVADFAEIGVRAVTFSGGGEPFCYPFLLETVEKLAENNIRFASLTNGSRLDGPLADIFSSHATWLRVSMDGWDDASYSALRGCPDGEFSRILHNMEQFKRRGGKCNLGVNIVVDHRNCHHLTDLFIRLQGSGVDSVKLSPCLVSDSGHENSLYHGPNLKTVREQLAKARDRVVETGMELFDSFSPELQSFAKGYHWCPYLQIAPVIGADQNLYACPDKAYNLDNGLIGSLKEQRFKDLWYAGKERFFRIDPAEVCHHHCLADSRNLQILDYLDADPEHLDFV